MKFAVCVLIRHPKGSILGVSRKNNPDDFGLPGGMIELGETPLEALTRELMEETGLSTRIKPELIFQEESNGTLTLTYDLSLKDTLGLIPAAISRNKEGAMFGWVTPDTLVKGSFGQYNKDLFREVGIKYKTSAGAKYGEYAEGFTAVATAPFWTDGTTGGTNND